MTLFTYFIYFMGAFAFSDLLTSCVFFMVDKLEGRV